MISGKRLLVISLPTDVVPAATVFSAAPFRRKVRPVPLEADARKEKKRG